MASIRTAGLTKHFGDLRAVNEIDLELLEVVGCASAVTTGTRPAVLEQRVVTILIGGGGRGLGAAVEHRGREAAVWGAYGALVSDLGLVGHGTVTGPHQVSELPPGRADKSRSRSSSLPCSPSLR